LVTADEVTDLQTKLQKLGHLAEEHIDLEQILRIANEAPALAAKPRPLAREIGATPRIAVARDEAFCFLYQENLAALSALGAELCFFSPIHNASLPERVHGLYLPGGYPELHEELLSSNASMRDSIKKAVAQGLPTIAECGGFLYLHDSLDGLPMVGIIPAEAYKTEKLQRFGYVTLTAKHGNLLCSAGDSIRAHEFHYYESGSCGDGFSAQKPTGRSWDCIHATPSLYAGFPHLYFPANIAFAKQFMRKAIDYASNHTGRDSAN
jgi:cobyrinic acid a,c-diamide synthase